MNRLFLLCAARRAVAVLTVAAVAACTSWSDMPDTVRNFGVYKLDINQGNYLTQDMVERLKVGQTRQQVRQALGTPLLTSAFHDNRWDYLYEYTRQGKLVEHRQFTVYFVDDKVARWEGDELPVSAAQLNRIAADRTLGPKGPTEEKGFWGRLLDVFKGDW